MFLWLGMSLSSQWIQHVFGVSSLAQVDTDRIALPVLDTPLNNRIRNIINQIHAERHRCMRVSLFLLHRKRYTYVHVLYLIDILFSLFVCFFT